MNKKIISNTKQLDQLGWGAAFIWAAIVLLMDISGFSNSFSGWNGFAVFFTGAGIIALTQAFIGYTILEIGQQAGTHLICGLVLISFGLKSLSSLIWVIIFILIAISIFKKSLITNKEQSEK